MVARGEVWWFEPPDAKRRPYLVLTRNEAIGVLREVIAVPATTVVRDIPTEVALGPSEAMPTDCVLTLDNVRSVPKALLVEHITTLDEATMSRVCAALAFATACD
ncbi:MAG: type II toxin-antitoxin system PemK/MazF family toxin [Acidimicrobiales bacterium]